jgi:uncharacterized secreted protein with C-terminal beta-propeller domain
MKMASVYLNKNNIYVVTFSKTTVGLYSAYYPIFFLKMSDSPSEIGKKALEALDGFTLGVPHPKNQEEFKKYDDEHDKAMQIKSWRSFVKKTKSIELEAKEKNEIEVIPLKNTTKIKDAGDFQPLPEKTRLCSPDPETLGLAILAAFEDCE